MNNTQMSARVGLFFIIGIVLIYVTFESLRGNSVSRTKGYTVVAGFPTLKELKAGDEVRMAGVKIGAVELTRLANGRAEAVLRILPEMQIAKDSVATISMAGLIGTNYVAINIGTPANGVVVAGGEILTRTAPDLNQIMSDLGSLGQDLKGAISNISSAFGGSDGKGGLFTKLDRLVSDNSAKIDATMANLEAITAKINQGQGTLGKLVNDPAAYDQLLATVNEIKGAAADARIFITNTQSIIDQVKTGKGTLGTLVYDEDAGNNIKLVVKNLSALSEKLNNPNSTFGQLIGNDQLIRDAQATLRKVDSAVDSMGDSGPISAVGVVAGKLF
ncbi:MAG: MCE family protein [Verrucomicrobia bacterium]|nr:MCE family protein [Verrucomicrobiota bacterium]